MAGTGRRVSVSRRLQIPIRFTLPLDARFGGFECSEHICGKAFPPRTTRNIDVTRTEDSHRAHPLQEWRETWSAPIPSPARYSALVAVLRVQGPASASAWCQTVVHVRIPSEDPLTPSPAARYDFSVGSASQFLRS